MKFDWRGGSTEVLFNSRLPAPELARVASEEIPALHRLAPSGHFWLLTSGSTSVSGAGTWVALSNEAVLCSAEAVNRHLGVTGRDIWIHALPSFHVGGLGIWARAYLSGSEVVDLSREGAAKWDPREFARVATEKDATLSALVPAQVHDLVAANLRAPASMRAIVVGGGALAPALRESALALGWPVLPSYGLTECCSQVATALPGDPEAKLALLPHVEARVGDEGRLEIRSGALFTGYARWQDGTWVLEDPKRDGWFETEDRGSVQDGLLSIEGRVGGFVKIGGESVHLPRLEEVLASVRLRLRAGSETDLALCALPDERLGHRIVLAVAGDVAPVRAIADEFNRRVLPFEAIREVVPVREIPRSALKKVILSALLRELSRAKT